MVTLKARRSGQDLRDHPMVANDAGMTLTKADKAVLITAGEFLLAGEWSETLSQKQYVTLRRVLTKLKQ